MNGYYMSWSGPGRPVGIRRSDPNVVCVNHRDRWMTHKVSGALSKPIQCQSELFPELVIDPMSASFNIYLQFIDRKKINENKVSSQRLNEIVTSQLVWVF